MIKVIALFIFAFGTAAFADKDRGAGSGYNGRPLESYVKDITQFKEFKTIVEPAIEKVRKKVPGLAEDLLRVAHLKNWFFVPVRLPEIPPERIGVTFKTDLYALQSIREIWFDDNLYKGLAEDNYRAMILTHELVMGLKLSSLYAANPACHYRIESSYCRLTSVDYESVRGLSVILFKTQDKMSAHEIIKFLNDNQFGRYNADSDMRQLETYDIDKLYWLLVSEQKTQSLPSLGRDSLGGGCAYEFNLSNDRAALEIKIYRALGTAALRDYPPVRIVLQTAPEIVVRKGMASIQYVTPVEKPTFGSYRRKIEIFINPERITRITAYWEVYVFNYRTGKDEWAKDAIGPLGEFEPVQRICEY